MQSTNHKHTKHSTHFVRPRVFFNSQKCTQGSSNWKLDFYCVVKTYADIVKSKNSQVYSISNIDVENNVTQGVKMYVKTKRTQSHVCTHKNKQGVRNPQGDDFFVHNTGKKPHMLPDRSYIHNIKKCKQRGFVTNVQNLQKSSFGVNKSKAFASSRVNSTYKGKTSIDSVDFVSHNKFSVLNDLQNDEITAVPHDSCATASEAVIAAKVSQTITVVVKN